MGEAELGEHGAGGSEAEVPDEVLSQESHRHGIEKERTLSGEADHASLRVELEELLMIQIIDAPRPSLSFELHETERCPRLGKCRCNSSRLSLGPTRLGTAEGPKPTTRRSEFSLSASSARWSPKRAGDKTLKISLSR